ncbi:MAG TPA: polymer-forming cytoskeletal protein [Pyrinomonadaceae bacterium]
MNKTPKMEPVERETQAAPQHPTYNAPVQPAAAAQFSYPAPTARPENTSPATPRAVMESESLAREIKDGTMSGFVGGGTVLTGEAVFKGMLRVDGHLTGHISSEKGTLIVSSGGRVDANINVAIAKINGIVNGDVIATERLEFGRTAQVYGDIQTPILIIEQGAVFEGNCRMSPATDGDGKEKTEKPREKDASVLSNMSRPISGKSMLTERLKSSNVSNQSLDSSA